MSKRRKTELGVISNAPNRRPYASRVVVLLEEDLSYGFDGEVCLLSDGDFIIRIRPEKRKVYETECSPQRLTATIEGFASASEAEKMGLKLSLGLLWSAVSGKHHLKLEYHTPQPCMVFDRTQKARGPCFSARLSIVSPASKLSMLVNEVLLKEMDPDPRLLVSMELFASSMLESTERARFISLISSLEPLASQEPYDNQEVGRMISELIGRIAQIDLPTNTRESIATRARDLTRGSISQSIVRLVGNHIPESHNATTAVKEAYGIRSKILHQGSCDVDLTEKSRQLAEIIRCLYSRILQLQLLVPTTFT